MRYDQTDWHSSSGNFPSDLPWKCGGTHIGMFMGWAIMNGLESEWHRANSQDELRQVRERRMTGRDFLAVASSSKFGEDDLNEEGNAFAREYYEASGRYFDDYNAVVANGLPSCYHVEDSWTVYDRIAEIIDRRYAEWKASRA